MQISVYFVPDTRKTQINGGAVYFTVNTRIVQFAAATRKALDYRHDELCYIQQKQHFLIPICQSPTPHIMQISVYFVLDTRKTQINGGAVY